MRNKIIAFVPARGGSKGLPLKNIRKINGIPLYQLSVSCAIEAGIGEIYVSTDIPEIIDSDNNDFIVSKRPMDLSSDDASMGEVLNNFVNEHIEHSVIMVLLQPTSPLRTLANVKSALELFHAGNFNMVLSVTETDRTCLKYGQLEGSNFKALSNPEFCFANRQQLPAVYKPNGAIYVFSSEMFRDSVEFSSINIGAIIMEPEASYDIDNLEDFQKCERALSC